MNTIKYKYKINIDSSKRYEKTLTLIDNSDSSLTETFIGEFDICQKIAEVLNKKDINISEVEFTFYEGPGESFTGLKMSAAFVNTINFALNRINSSQAKMPNYGREPNITISSKNKLV